MGAILLGAIILLLLLAKPNEYVIVCDILIRLVYTCNTCMIVCDSQFFQCGEWVEAMHIELHACI